MFTSGIKKNYWNYKTFNFNYPSNKSNIKYIKLISSCYIVTLSALSYKTKDNDILHNLECW